VDEGEIIAQAEVDLRGVQSVEEVERRGLAVEHKLYPETLKAIFTKQ
jgi:phosphoribosylglycinamide formyltransferase-1